ncbi:MAG: glycosyltransferase [Thermodesulfobium sp.]
MNDDSEVKDMNQQSQLIYYLKRFLNVWRQEGARSVWNKVLHKIRMFNELTSNEDEEVHFKVSIIIPVYNALSMTKACLRSIYNETRDLEFEIIIVDNASDDDTYKWLMEEKSKHSNLKIFRIDRNIGFGPAVNFGIQRCKGEFVVILNNDTIVSPGWLDNLLAVAKADLSVGIVSPVTNYVDEGPQIDVQAQNLSPDPIAIAQYAKSIVNRTDIFYEPNRLVFFCVLIRRELIDLIGYLDEGYEKGNFEDDDYCLRARMAGYRLAIAKNSFVYRHGSVTFKANRIFHSKWMQVNRERFYAKAGRIAVSSLPRLSSPLLSSPLKVDKTVSVILRTKDRPRLLLNALNSLKNQTYREFEVVLVNDGGEDVSSLVALFKEYFPIKYIKHNVCRGRTAAINTGLQNADGKWIAYLDDDDIFYPWHLETLLRAAENNSAKVIYSNYNRALFENSDSLFPIRLVGVQPWDYNRQELLIQNYLPIHSYIHSRECVDKVGLWNESLDRLEDYEFLLRLSALFDFYHVKKVTCEYRYYLDSENSITPQGREIYLTAFQEIYQKFPVDTPDLIHSRQMIEDIIRKQIKQISEIMKSSQGTNISDVDVRRKIIQLVIGI